VPFAPGTEYARAKSALAHAVKDGGDVTEARRRFLAAKIERFVSETVASAPELTDEQVDRIVAILRPVEDEDGPP
jgi:hypothetical protein